MIVSRSAPLLKAWLDENLPAIVDGLVSAQMEKQLCRHNSIGFDPANKMNKAALLRLLTAAFGTNRDKRSFVCFWAKRTSRERRERVSLTKMTPKRSGTGLRSPRFTLAWIAEMDDPMNVDELADIGRIAAAKQVKPEHFPASFDVM